MEAIETLSIKDIMHRLVERPQDFQLIGNTLRKEGDFDYNILYNGTVWRYHNTAVVWVIQDIVR